jgi:hypothetical protein
VNRIKVIKKLMLISGIINITICYTTGLFALAPKSITKDSSIATIIRHASESSEANLDSAEALRAASTPNALEIFNVSPWETPKQSPTQKLFKSVSPTLRISHSRLQSTQAQETFEQYQKYEAKLPDISFKYNEELTFYIYQNIDTIKNTYLIFFISEDSSSYIEINPIQIKNSYLYFFTYKETQFVFVKDIETKDIETKNSFSNLSKLMEIEKFEDFMANQIQKYTPEELENKIIELLTNSSIPDYIKQKIILSILEKLDDLSLDCLLTCLECKIDLIKKTILVNLREKIYSKAPELAQLFINSIYEKDFEYLILIQKSLTTADWLDDVKFKIIDFEFKLLKENKLNRFQKQKLFDIFRIFLNNPYESQIFKRTILTDFFIPTIKFFFEKDQEQQKLIRDYDQKSDILTDFTEPPEIDLNLSLNYTNLLDTLLRLKTFSKNPVEIQEIKNLLLNKFFIPTIKFFIEKDQEQQSLLKAYEQKSKLSKTFTKKPTADLSYKNNYIHLLTNLINECYISEELLVLIKKINNPKLTLKLSKLLKDLIDSNSDSDSLYNSQEKIVLIAQTITELNPLNKTAIIITKLNELLLSADLDNTTKKTEFETSIKEYPTMIVSKIIKLYIYKCIYLKDSTGKTFPITANSTDTIVNKKGIPVFLPVADIGITRITKLLSIRFQLSTTNNYDFFKYLANILKDLQQLEEPKDLLTQVIIEDLEFIKQQFYNTTTFAIWESLKTIFKDESLIISYLSRKYPYFAKQSIRDVYFHLANAIYQDKSIFDGERKRLLPFFNFKNIAFFPFSPLDANKTPKYSYIDDDDIAFVEETPFLYTPPKEIKGLCSKIKSEYNKLIILQIIDDTEKPYFLRSFGIYSIPIQSRDDDEKTLLVSNPHIAIQISETMLNFLYKQEQDGEKLLSFYLREILYKTYHNSDLSDSEGQFDLELELASKIFAANSFSREELLAFGTIIENWLEDITTNIELQDETTDSSNKEFIHEQESLLSESSTLKQKQKKQLPILIVQQKEQLDELIKNRNEELDGLRSQQQSSIFTQHQKQQLSALKRFFELLAKLKVQDSTIKIQDSTDTILEKIKTSNPETTELFTECYRQMQIAYSA